MKNTILIFSLLFTFSAQAFEFKNSCELKQDSIKDIIFQKSEGFDFYSIIKKNSETSISNKKCEYLHNVRSAMFQELGISMPKIKSNKKIKIAVIDTGLDFSIPAFKNKIYKPEGIVSNNFYGLDLEDGDFQPQDTHGHGTHVSGIIVSLFPNAKILPIKTASSDKSYTRAIALAIEAKVDIINISGGGDGSDKEELRMIKLAKKKNILIIAASGNNRKNLNKDSYFPASYNESNIISVMAHDKNGKLASYSNYGKSKSHIAALGTLKSYHPNKEGCVDVVSGTSQATPVITATIAMIMAENPNWSIAQIKQHLMVNAESNEHLYDLNDSKGKVHIHRSVASQK